MNKNISKYHIPKNLFFDQFYNLFFFIIITSTSLLLLQFILFIKTDNLIPEAGILVFNFFFIIQYLPLIFIKNFNCKEILFYIYFLNIILGSFLYFYYIKIGLPYGFNAADAFFYQMISRQTANIEFFDFFRWASVHIKDFSDFGFAFSRFVLAKVSKNIETQNYILVLVNCTFFSFSLKRFADLLSIDFEQKLINLVILLLGINSYSIYLHSSGLKENIFLFFIISSFYYVKKFDKKRNIINLSMLVLNITAVSFFRWYVAAFFPILIIYSYIKNFLLTNTLLPYFLIIVTLTGVFISAITDFFKVQEGYFYLAKSLQQYRVGTSSGIIANFLASLIGPFASLIESKQTAPLIHNSSNYIKSALSFFFLYGSLKIFQKKCLAFYPYIIFCFLNIFLVNASATSFDMRFQYTMIPFFYLISIYGLLYASKKIIRIYLMYLIAILLPVTYLYNIR